MNPIKKGSTMYKKLIVSLLAVLALSSVAVASASAHEFIASKTGTLKGHALNTQEFTTNGGVVKCTEAATTGKVTETKATSQVVKVTYGKCTAFGFVETTISPAEYLLDASGAVKILNTILIDVKVPIIGTCSVTVGPQEIASTSSVSYANKSGKIEEKSNVEGITYTSSGGSCGSSGTNGKYVGNNEVELEGGTVEWK
jgi:hypothetical protein